MAFYSSQLKQEPEAYSFVLLHYKTQVCPNDTCTDPSCHFFHSLSDRRRTLFSEDFSSLNYSDEQCFEEICPENCRKSHNYFECHFHLLTYKTYDCPDKEHKSPNIICPFVHEGEVNRKMFIEGIKQFQELYSPKKESQTSVEFSLPNFKVEPCPFSQPHPINTCIYYHSKKDKRRHLSSFTYSADECPNKEKCPNGDLCKMSHNKAELFYHPDKYKKKLCAAYPTCKFGGYCSFAHFEEELKIKIFLHKLNHDEAFFTTLFKTVSCPFSLDHDKAMCDYYHNPQDFRRNPKEYNYEPLECQYWVKRDIITYEEGGCPNHKQCKRCHGWKELEYHPLIYKTKKCSDSRFCKKKICSYYHTIDEKRLKFE